MSHLICKTLHHVRPAIRASPSKTKAYNLYYFIHIYPFSTPLTSIETSSEQSSFTVTYLINSLGFPLENALRASKYCNFKSPEKPDSVLAFFENQGFTKTQISKLIRKNPLVLTTADPQKRFLPKLEFFKSKGVSSPEIAELFSFAPTMLRRSLENQVIPSFNFLTDVLQSEEKAIFAMKRCDNLLSVDLRTEFGGHMKILREAGVPNAFIVFSLTKHPRIFMTSPQNFKQTVEEVGKMGFNPSKLTFTLAVCVLRSVKRSIWEKKVEVYKKWGWSEDEILAAFRKDPWCMAASERKIMAAMDFFVNKVGLESSFLVERPSVIKLSLEKRIVPRFAVTQVLLKKGLIKKRGSGLMTGLMTMLRLPDKCFLKKFVNCYGEEAPELLKLYKKSWLLQINEDMCIKEWIG